MRCMYVFLLMIYITYVYSENNVVDRVRNKEKEEAPICSCGYTGDRVMRRARGSSRSSFFKTFLSRQQTCNKGGAAVTDRVGQQLGNYRLLRLLGQGMIAEVYLGEHLHLGMQAAIKVLRVHLTNEDSEQLHAEARLIARLVHPHIVRLFDFDVKDGRPFLIMEYAPNGTLRQRHPKGTLVPLDIVVSYVKQLAEALHYVHELGRVHCDIKPENIVIGHNHELLLSDFGLAFTGQSSYSRQTQGMVRTSAYMALEQIQGNPVPASDQYALGIVVYECLSGDTPFHGLFQEFADQHLSVLP